tara:strand:- start:1285 stop:1950 length:666 start_codon:yes stop_codon:yes gene_type:complete
MGAGIAVGQGIIGMAGAIGASNRADDDLRGKRAERLRLDAELQSLEDSRQPVINPYQNVTDLSGKLSNPFANLGVATQAAEFQAEQADISLANTLDTIRATGASAGGATALAQAALQSKKQVSASIEMQEAQNQKLQAKGEQQLQQAKMQEAQRLQSADVMGQQFMFGATETRETAKLNRTAGLIDQSAADVRSAEAAAGAAEGAKYNAASNLLGTSGGFF